MIIDRECEGIARLRPKEIVMSRDQFSECFNQYFPMLSWFGAVLIMGAIQNNWLGRLAALL